MEEGIAIALWFFVELLIITTGRAVIAAISLGRWRGEQTDKKEGKTHGAAGALSFIRNGQRVVTSTGLFLAGLIFYISLVLFLVYAMAS